MIANYAKADQKDERRPINYDILSNLLQIHDSISHSYYDHAFYCLYILMYRMALRISEISNYSTKFRHALTPDDFQLRKDQDSIKVTLRSYKHSKDPKHYNITVSPRFIYHYHRFIEARGQNNSQFFVHQSGAPFSRNFIASTLSEDLLKIGKSPKFYNTHSFRIGRASDLAQQGASDNKIAEIGRWNSSAFHKYIRPDIKDA